MWAEFGNDVFGKTSLTAQQHVKLRQIQIACLLCAAQVVLGWPTGAHILRVTVSHAPGWWNWQTRGA